MAGRSRAKCCCHSRAVSGCMLCLLAGEVIGVSTLPTTPLSDTPLLPHPTQIARRSHADAHAHRQMPTHIEGPPVHVRRNPPLPADGAAGLPEALIRLWTDVSNAGGAVGFVAPVALDDVRAVADDLVVAYEDGRPVAFGLLVTNDFVLARHWGTVKRLQRDPRLYGLGVGARVLAELEACALDRGLERVCLTVRGRTGRERFYEAHGYRVDARLPGRLRLAGGVTVDELHLSKLLAAGAEPKADDEAEHGRAHEAEQRPGAEPVLLVQRLDPGLPLPAYARPGDAGLDLCAAADVEVAAGERAVVPTGVAIALPPGHVGLVHPRSGLAARHGLALVNAPGTIDAGYRGEVQVILVNLDPDQAVTLHRGDRIAQLVIQPVTAVAVREVGDLDRTTRGEGGFGSTGR